VNISISCLSVRLVYLLFHRIIPYQTFLLTVVTTIILLILGEFTPKFAAVNYSESLSIKAYSLLCFFKKLFLPFTFFIDLLISFLWRKKNEPITLSEIHTMVTIAKEEGSLSEVEHRFIERMLNMKRVKARDIMTPRTKFESVDENISISSFIRMKGIHSRIPVYCKNVDNIVGVVYTKDAILYARPEQVVRSIMRKPFFVPDNINLSYLLRNFQEKRVHIAICINEYGGVEGLITMDDILKLVTG
jgi:putative hemolysin